MDIFNVLTLIGGLCLFLFGMNLMGNALERRAGGSLKTILSRMTTNKFAGFITGCGTTAIIQSSSATTVMVVGFVNSGLMTLHQAVNVIMGANVGTTVTGWILSLGGISGSNIWVRLLKPASFTPILALIGIIIYMFGKKSKNKDSGTILLGFATLMFGMETMTAAVSGLADIPSFRQFFIMFENPFLGLLAGAALTAIIQSSSASVGILQALAVTGQVSYGAAIPIVMGSAIGTCVTAMLSCVGAKKDAKRAAAVHLFFNVIGAGFWLAVYYAASVIFSPAILNSPASLVGIAVVNTSFKILSTALLMPMSGLLEKLACKLVPDSKTEENKTELDDRLLAAPALALQQCRKAASEMAVCSVNALKNAVLSFTNYTPELAEKIRSCEEDCDRYEDIIGNYLVKLSYSKMNEDEGEDATLLLKTIGDFERISDHAVNILESAEELRAKKLTLTESAVKEFETISLAVTEILDLSFHAFINKDVAAAAKAEPLEQVIDVLKEQIRTRHILRMRKGNCSIELGFIWSDLLTDMERTSDHCSNIAACVLDASNHTLNLHKTLHSVRTDNEDFDKRFMIYAQKYSLDE